MADIDVGAGALGGRIRAHVSAVPPGGWVGLCALAVVCVLAWHFWDQDDADTSNWMDPEQPPEVVGETKAAVAAGPLTARARRFPGSLPGAH